MNKFKFWKIESHWEKYFPLCKEERKEERDILKEIKEEISKNYSQNISIYNKNFLLVKKLSFVSSKDIVFVGEDRGKKDKNNIQKNFYGLKKQQLFFGNKKAIYLVDNHNKAIFPFLEIRKSLELIKGNSIELRVIHIDAHRDNATFGNKYPQSIDWKNINSFIEKTRVSDYLDLALKSKLVSNVINITQSFEFDDFISQEIIINKNNNKEVFYVLSLDIDIFGPEGLAVSLEQKIKSIAKAWNVSAAVVIATSPGYILKEDAEKIIKIFTKKN